MFARRSTYAYMKFIETCKVIIYYFTVNSNCYRMIRLVCDQVEKDIMTHIRKDLTPFDAASHKVIVCFNYMNSIIIDVILFDFLFHKLSHCTYDLN